MKKLTPIKRSLSLAMLMLTLLMVIGMLGATVFADDTAAAVETTAAATDTTAAATDTTAAAAGDTGAAETTDAAETTADPAAVAESIKAQIKNQQSGFWHTLSIPFGYVVRGCSIVCGGHYALALILYALAMKILLFPFGIKQQKNSIKQARLRPKEQAIRDKYAGRTDRATQQKIQAEIQELYRRENFSPFAGCLPLLLQLPIIFALYRVVYNPLYHIVGLATDKITQIATNLVNSGALQTASRGDIDVLGTLSRLTPDQYSAAVKGVTDVAQADLPNLSLFGLDLSMSPTQGGNFWYYLIPILVFVSSFMSMKLMRKFSYQPTAQGGDAGKSLKIMDFVMPAFSAFIALSFPSLLGLYWIYQSLLGVLQQIILYKMYPLPQFTEEDYAAARREIMGKEQKKKKPASGPRKYNPKSLHHIDDDDDEEEEPASRRSRYDDDDDGEDRPTLLNGEKLPEQKGIVPPAALKEDVPAPEKKKKNKDK